MIQFLLFFISFSLVVTSSYFLTSVIKSKKLANSLLFLVLIAASQLILSVELLSIFKKINQNSLLIVNIIFFMISLAFWLFQKKPCINIKQGFEIIPKIKSELSKDRILQVLLYFFTVASVISFMLAILAPPSQFDSMVYHLGRVGFWIQNQTLNHYPTTSVRQLIFPVNSEIFLLWSMIFVKKDYIAGLSQYCAYIGSIFILFNFLLYLRISIRRILWAIFIFASLPAIILQASSTQNDFVLGFFLFSSFYLFMYGVREKDKASLIFSAVAFSIAMGIKSSVFFFIPALGTVYLLISIRTLKKEFYKPIGLFITILIPAFILLGSYNYVLNYLDYGNPMGSFAYIHQHTADSLTYKAFMANLIRYLFGFFDFSGIDMADKLNVVAITARLLAFKIFNLNDGDGLISSDLIGVSTRLHENYAMCGILGFILLLPIVFRYGFTRIWAKGDREFIFNLTCLSLIIFMLTISLFMGYKRWNDRYFVTAIVLCSPILALTYRATKLKIIICLIAVFSYVRVSTCNTIRPVFPVNGKSIVLNTRDELRYLINQGATNWYPLMEYLELTVPDNSKIAVILSDGEWYYPFFDKNPTWKIYAEDYEDLIRHNNFKDYDYIVKSGDLQIIYNDDKKNKRTIWKKINTEVRAIPSNFELVNVIEPEGADKKIYSYKFYIFKKMTFNN